MGRIGFLPTVPAQYDIGAPLMTTGPTRSGAEAASTIVAQPPWQLPITAGRGAFG